MTFLFLPIIQRELRAASRRRSTRRVRWWTALIALAITVCGLAFMSVSRGLRGSGGSLFAVLTGYACFLCLVSGVLLTADTLARERREGTLGLLFLTNLRGYDIVLGKFFTQCLNTFYALLAILPAAALPLLLGGLEIAEFFRMALALFNALCVSAAIGMLASALCRESHSALSAGVGLLVLISAVLPLLSVGLTSVGVAPVWQFLAWLSPVYPYAHSEASSYSGREVNFWASLMLSHLFGWALLGVTSLTLPRVIGDATARGQVRATPLPRLARKTRKGRRDLLMENPILWLRGSELGIPWPAWLVVGLWAGTMAVILIVEVGLGSAGPGIDAAVELAARLFGFFLKLLFALHACRFFVDARRDGTLELLLCTPLTNQQIVQGQMKALWRAYRWPFFTLLIVLCVPIILRLVIGVSQSGPGSGPVFGAAFSYVSAGGFVLRMALDIVAILWVGTALALTSRRPSLAPAWTVLFVLLLPSPLAFCWLDILVDLVLISWATNQCRLDLRRLVAEQYQAIPLRSLTA
jgi:ABC-type transport system involved in multi-copper enzyme maturation permease subunit